jgi:hypothetical protein
MIIKKLLYDYLVTGGYLKKNDKTNFQKRSSK